MQESIYTYNFFLFKILYLSLEFQVIPFLKQKSFTEVQYIKKGCILNWIFDEKKKMRKFYVWYLTGICCNHKDKLNYFWKHQVTVEVIRTLH